MRIGVNATCINDRPSGARQRFVGLFSHLVRLMPDSEFVFFEPEDCRVAECFADAPNVSARRTPLNSERRVQRFLRGLSYWKGIFATEHFDVFEALHLPIVCPPTGKTLLTIHDVRGLHPGNSWLAQRIFRMTLSRSLTRADRVVTVSNAMRSEICAFSTVTPVSVVYNGLGSEHFMGIDPEIQKQVCLRLQLPQRFLLSVGHFEPRKNYSRLIEALALLHRDGFRYPLVIVGNDSGECRRVMEQVHSSGLEQSVKIFSGLSDVEVRCVYHQAAMLVFPSSYEGFGIPLLEAMAASIPIAASNLPVFREILGAAGVYFDPQSPESISDVIRETLTDAVECARLTTLGKVQVGNFDFNVLAREMARIYSALN